MTGMAHPLIIDTDPGVDDAIALVLALNSPEVQVRAVTAGYGNAGLEDTFRNARRVLALAGRTDVPVAPGAARPLVHPHAERASHVHGSDGLGGRGAEFPEPDGPEPGAGSALSLAAAVLRGADQPVTIASIGPLTNTALLLAAHPELTDKIDRIVVMGGAVGRGNVTAVSEFNVHSDPEAAHRVLSQDEVPVTLVPLDLTMRCLVDPAWLAALDASGPRCALLGRVLAPYQIAFRRRHGIDGVALHDAVAVLEAIVPGTLRCTPMPVSVACDLGPARGMLVPDQRPDAVGPRVDVALDADLGRVLAEILARVRRLG
jgi:pyrimidine-specific ribonucleoside hydrolase